jgi:hypothetical protein
MMNDPLVEAAVAALRESPSYRLSAIIEMARLSPATRDKLMEHYADQFWPLLQQEQFANLRDIGPWLFGARPGSGVSAQYEFLWGIRESAGTAVCGWIISAMAPVQLVQHLSHANVVTGPDGHPYLLRYHTSLALQVLSVRQELPGIVDLLAPIKYWWIPLAHPKNQRAYLQSQRWYQIAGYDRPEATQRPTLTLDEACWEALAGDPLSHRIAELLKHEKPTPDFPESCHGTRLGLIQYYLDAAREQGLSREDDLITYVLMMAHNGEQMNLTPAWQQALAAARDQRTSLSDAVQTYLRPISC